MSRTSRVLFAAVLLAGAGSGAALAGKANEVRVQAIVLLNEGVAAYNRGDYRLAVEKLRQSAALALNHFRAYYYLGLALSGDRRYSEAIEQLQVALDLDPSHLQAHVAMGDAYLKQGDTEEAMASYYRALKLRGEFPAALDGIARVYESKADDEKAIEFFRRSIASNKGFADAYAHLGSLYLRLDRLDEAVRLLTEAITIRPDFAEGYDGLASAYVRLQLPNDAVVTIQKAIDLEPRSPEHWTTLGEIELEMGLPSRAESSFEKALELDPKFPTAQAGQAEAARRRGDYDAALQHLMAALSDPRLDSRTRARLEEKRAATEMERAEAAKLEWQVAAGGAPPEAYRRLAAICAGRNQWARAADLQTLGEPSGVERERLAYYLLRAGRHREAHLIYSELALGAGRADLEMNAGVALAGMGDDPGAAEAYRRALTLSPTEKRARLYLANALLRLGRRNEAAPLYKKYLDDVETGPERVRVRRILAQIAPELLPPEPGASPPPAAAEPGS